MILYKYMSADSAKGALANGTIGFAKPNTFNDPFELEAGYPVSAIQNNVVETFLNKVRSDAKRSIWADSSGVLSLTRNPLNPLMWSHYGQEHRGVVVGIDTHVAGLDDVATCLIPAHYGSIIYTNTRPHEQLPPPVDVEPLNIAHTHAFPVGHFAKLSQIFLQKPACWSYEEEVRVVKCLSDRDSDGKSVSGRFTEVELPQKVLYCYELPKGSIKEVYFGMRHPALNTYANFAKALADYSCGTDGVKVMGCRLSKDTWSIEDFDPMSVWE
jgi:Protein of unknown function (DUF2971)